MLSLIARLTKILLFRNVETKTFLSLVSRNLKTSHSFIETNSILIPTVYGNQKSIVPISPDDFSSSS